MSDTGDLFNYKPLPSPPHFNGPCYTPKLDHVRLTGQIARIYRAMDVRIFQWKTLDEIAHLTGDPEASISAQLRHLRKKRFGSHTIKKRRRGEPERGHWEYRLIPNTDASVAFNRGEGA